MAEDWDSEVSSVPAPSQVRRKNFAIFVEARLFLQLCL